VEEVLKRWFVSVRDKGGRVDRPILKQKAESLAVRMGHTDFCATEGWFNRWKKRENMVWCSLKGEAGEADAVAANAWLHDVWPTIVEEYSPDVIFNADETGLHYRALPEHTYMFKNDKKNLKGVKTCKQHVSVLCCTSMPEKREELLVIGKSKSSHCFKGIKKLLVQYCANASAWMTSIFFTEWLQAWDRQLTRKIVLLVDNCTAHSTTCMLKNIQIVHLLANTTSLIQPCDQGIIKTLKTYYQHDMQSRVVEMIDENLEKEEHDLNANDLTKKTTALDAIHLFARAWDTSVTEGTICNCFRKGGFTQQDATNGDNFQEQTLPFHNDVDKDLYEEWLNIDESMVSISYILVVLVQISTTHTYSWRR